MSELELLKKKSIQLAQVKLDGIYTFPRSYGVYKLSDTLRITKQYRFGNHPIRMKELMNEFGTCEHFSELLFLERNDAKRYAQLLNQGEYIE